MIVGHIGAGSSSVDTGDIQKSLRFRASASAYLSRTPTVSGNRKTWTWSGWVKRGTLGVSQGLFEGYATSLNLTSFQIAADETLNFQLYLNPTYNTVWKTTAVFRDPSAWYHVVLSFDTTQASQANMVKLYVNGVQQTVGYTNYNSAIPQNSDWYVNATNIHYFGRYVATNPLDGYLSRVCFIDGQALTPSSFGYLNTETNAWVTKSQSAVKAVVDAGGTNSFMLDFDNGTSLTTLGYDKSVKGNNWTCNNISLTAGVTYDHMLDVPGNSYATLNPLRTVGGNHTPSNGNLRLSCTANAWGWKPTTLPVSLFPTYWETVVPSATNGTMNGIATGSATSGDFTGNGTVRIAGNGRYWVNGVEYTSGAPIVAVNDVLRHQYDPTTGAYKVAVNGGSWFQVVTGLSGEWFATAGGYGGTDTTDMLLGQAPLHASATYDSTAGGYFRYAPPTGFKALCTKNLPEVPASLLDPTDHHIDITVTKSGDTNFTLPWDASVYDTFFEIKRRDASGDWYQIDGLRGYDKILKSNSTAAETTDANVLGVSGTTCTLKSTLPNGVYIISATKAGLSSARQTNTDGTITSTVSRNVVSGFAIVLYTGTGAGSATVGHGLGQTLGFMPVKQRDAGGALYAWNSYHKALGGGSYIQLNTTNAASLDIYLWSNTAPSSTVITLGTTTGNYNQVNNYLNCRYVAYCYADSAIQKSFSYTGNGSTDGPYVNLGFKCGRTLTKSTTDGTGSWLVFDSVREPSNVVDLNVRPHVSDLESSQAANYLDYTAQGVKIRGNNSGSLNIGSGTYIGHAWAAVTGKYSNAR